MQSVEIARPGAEPPVRALRGGSGPPLLYLHHVLGLSPDEPVLARLGERHDVVAPYAPGWGPAKDDLTGTDAGPLELVLHLVDLLDGLGLERVDVVGTSIGGWLGAELAAVMPHRVGRLVLVNPLGLWLEEAPGRDLFAQNPLEPSAAIFSRPELRQTLLIEGSGGDEIESVVTEMLDLRAAARFLWPIPDTGVSRRLPRITSPTVVLTGDDDPFVPAEQGAAWAQAIPAARHRRLAGAGHLLALEDPDRFAEVAEESLGTSS